MKLRGRTLGGYVVEEGGDGSFRARRDGATATVAARAAPDAATAERWLAAARAARAVEHEAVARVLDAGVIDDPAEPERMVWVLTERLEGTPLAVLLRAGGPLPAARFVPMFEGLCAGVARAHELGVVHGDVRLERVAVSAAAGQLAARLSACGTALADGDAAAADDVAALAALARDALEGGRALVSAELCARAAGPAALAAEIRAAAGLAASAPAPRLEEGLRARMLAGAPQPLAEAVAALDAAASPEAALAAVGGVARVLSRYLAALALAARSRIGASSRTDPAEVAAALRALRQRTLEDQEWLGLALALSAPFSDSPELHPVPALPAFLAAAGEPLARLLDAGELTVALGDLAEVFEAGRVLLEHPLVVPHGDRAEVWMGIRRAAPLTVPLPAPLPEGWPVILDPSGQPALSLYPLVQVAEPAPGEAAEVFLLAGPGRRGARLESASGAILDDERLWSWFGENVLNVTAQIAVISVDAPPWRGLLPYGAEHAPIYFGREREAQALVNRLRIEPIVTVVGAAGAGKTSLVQAGVIPSLPRGWRALTVRPGATPLAALAEALGAPVGRAELAADPDALGRALRAAAGDEKLLLVVDPFEELFSRCADEVERQQAALGLARAARAPSDPVRVLCVVRDQYLVRLEGLPGWRERAARGLHVCATPAPDDLVRALVEPARLSGHDFEEGALPDALAAEVAPLPDGLARLSLMASLLWEKRAELRLPSAAARDLGGAGGVLERFVADRLAPFTSAERAAIPDVVRRRRSDPALAEKLVAAGLLDAGGEPLHEVLRPLLLERPPTAAPIVLPPPSSGMRLAVIAGLAAAVLGLGVALLRAGDQQADLGRARAAAEEQVAASRGQLTDALVERGRRSLLAGDARAAAADLGEAARRGAGGDALRLLRARAEAAAAGARLMLRHTGSIWMAGFSPDGARLVTAGDDHTARVWDARSGNLLFTLAGHDGTVWSARFSPDGRRIVTTADDKMARLWDADDGKTLGDLVGHERAVLDASLAGERPITFSLDGTIRVWEAMRPATLASGVTSFAISADGRLVAGGADDGSARVFDVARGAAVATLAGHGEAVLGVGLSPDGRYACTASADRSLRLWAVAGGRLLHEGREHTGEVTGCVFSPDGARVVTTAADHTAKIWDVGSGDLLATLPHGGEVSRAAFSPDGAEIVTASSDGAARLWDGVSGRPRGVLTGHEDSVWWVAWAPSGKEVVTAGLDGNARVWAARRDPLLLAITGHGDAVSSARWSRDGARLVTASRDKSARLWDAASGAELAVWPHDDTVRSAELSPDGALVLTASKDGRARLFTAAKGGGGGAEPVVIEAGGPLTCARFSPDGQTIATVEEHGPITLWTRQGRRLGALAVGGALDARFSPDGARMVVAGGTAAAIWDVAGGKELLRLAPHRLAVQSAAFSADGARVITASSDRTAVIWNAASGAALVTLRGHTHELRRAELSPSGALAVTVAGDGTARLWDARSGALLDVLAVPDWLYDAAFSPDGTRLVTAGADRTVRVWDTRLAQP